MEEKLAFEAFASEYPVKPAELFLYEFHTNEIGNNYYLLRGGVWKLRNRNNFGIFEDGTLIYSTKEIDSCLNDCNFEIKFIGKKLLPVMENKKVYEQLIQYCIEEKLKTVLIFDKYRKYSCKSSVTSKWILSDGNYKIFQSENREINLQRKYNFEIKILNDGRACIKLFTSSIFASTLNVQDYINKGIDVLGMEVKNDWGKNNQSGFVSKICDFTVSDKIDFADSLKAYYTEIKKEDYLVKDISDKTKVVMVQLKSGTELPYYPQALVPILTREKVELIDPNFSKRIENLVKRDMQKRYILDLEIISDIGELNSLNGMRFQKELCNPELLGYKSGKLELPQLICGNNKKFKAGEEFKVFNYGFFQKPEKKIKIGYLYPRQDLPAMKAVANSIYSFANSGNYHGKDDQFTTKGLINIQTKPAVQEEYEEGNLLDYKRAAIKLQKDDVDIVIAIVPNGRDEVNPYNPFKTIWAEANIPSQMISKKTAELFLHDNVRSNTTKYYLWNLILGILGKVGGIPWVIDKMPGNVDCFVGLDVAKIEKGIHYPACSVVFDKNGKLLGFYKPKQVQKGEKISTKILQEIFDNVLLNYEQKFKKLPQNIVIHRDGFNNEQNEWYEQYFESKKINYTLVEVRKNICSKIISLNNGKIQNPMAGSFLYKENKAYLVTTNLKVKKGSPNPLIIEKKCGDLSLDDIVKQVFYLSQMHVGSTQNMRLPITTGYADKICKSKDFVPEGKMDNRLFFL